MATKKDIRRTKIKFRIRHKVSGTAEMPRLSVFRSNKEIYAQVIDDVKGVTLTAASSKEKGFEKSGTKSEVAAKVGKTVAERALAAGINTVVFDRWLSLPWSREEFGRWRQRRWFKILIKSWQN